MRSQRRLLRTEILLPDTMRSDVIELLSSTVPHMRARAKARARVGVYPPSERYGMGADITRQLIASQTRTFRLKRAQIPAEQLKALDHTSARNAGVDDCQINRAGRRVAIFKFVRPVTNQREVDYH